MRLYKQFIALAILALVLAIPLSIAIKNRKHQLDIERSEKSNLQNKIQESIEQIEKEKLLQQEIQKQNDELKKQLEAKIKRKQWLATLEFPVAQAPAWKVRDALAYYTEQGLTKTATAYLVGNLVAESGLDHTNTTGDGGRAHGLAQWHPNRRHDMPADYHAQLAFVLVEMKRQTPQAYELLTTDPTEAEAAQAMKIFEGYGIEGGRFANARAILARI